MAQSPPHNLAHSPLGAGLQGLGTLGAVPRNGAAAHGGNGLCRLSLLPLLAAVLLLFSTLGGCSTARDRDTPTGPASLMGFKNDTTYEYFHETYRTGNLYVEFRPALVVDAIVEDSVYRELYVKMLEERYYLTPQQTLSIKNEQQERLQTSVEILVFLYEGSNQKIRLDRKNARWRILLKDDEGQLLEPASIKRIKKDNRILDYLDQYFYGMDRWSQVYRLSFPKLSKGILGQPVGEQPFELIITGVRGTVTLQWENHALFYQIDKQE